MLNDYAIRKTPDEGDDVMKFSPGDLAVYPAHGVGRIESIESREIDGEKQDFYIMQIREKRMIIMIPVKNAEMVCLRRVVGKDDVPEIYKILKTKRPAIVNNITWNRRHREYIEKIKSGSLYDVAEVFRDIFTLKSVKELSFGERKLFDIVKGLLINEICVAKDQDENSVMHEIESLFEADNGS
jgi:CarD family transcriptional regulator